MIIINSKPRHLRAAATHTAITNYFSSGWVNWQLTSCTQGWHLPTDVFETGDEICVKVEISGMNENDFQIFAESTHLIIKGSRKDNNEPLHAYHQMEIRYGEFTLEVDLPVSVQVNQVTAEYNRGFLIITLPKEYAHKILPNGE